MSNVYPLEGIMQFISPIEEDNSVKEYLSMQCDYKGMFKKIKWQISGMAIIIRVRNGHLCI